jgi:hypothetical protein
MVFEIAPGQPFPLGERMIVPARKHERIIQERREDVVARCANQVDAELGLAAGDAEPSLADLSRIQRNERYCPEGLMTRGRK